LPRADSDPDLASACPWSLAWLDLPLRGRDALAQLEDVVGTIKQEYPWVGPRPHAPKLGAKS
jgi:hypothetical protein